MQKNQVVQQLLQVLQFIQKEQTLTLPASGSVVVTAYATVATAVTGLAAPVGAVTATITVRDLASELAVANAALAAERAGRAADKASSDKALADAVAKSATTQAAADLAKAAYIAEFNALAKKWNAKNPKAKVKLKK